MKSWWCWCVGEASRTTFDLVLSLKLNFSRWLDLLLFATGGYTQRRCAFCTVSFTSTERKDWKVMTAVAAIKAEQTKQAELKRVLRATHTDTSPHLHPSSSSSIFIIIHHHLHLQSSSIITTIHHHVNHHQSSIIHHPSSIIIVVVVVVGTSSRHPTPFMLPRLPTCSDYSKVVQVRGPRTTPVRRERSRRLAGSPSTPAVRTSGCFLCF